MLSHPDIGAVLSRPSSETFHGDRIISALEEFTSCNFPKKLIAVIPGIAAALIAVTASSVELPVVRLIVVPLIVNDNGAIRTGFCIVPIIDVFEVSKRVLCSLRTCAEISVSGIAVVIAFPLRSNNSKEDVENVPTLKPSAVRTTASPEIVIVELIGFNPSFTNCR